MRVHVAFQGELQALINRYSMENGSDTPDFILAQYMAQCLEAYNIAVTRREKWYGRTPLPIKDVLQTDVTPPPAA